MRRTADTPSLARLTKTMRSQASTSLHRSLQEAFWTFGTVLVLVYAVFVGSVSVLLEDDLLLRQVDLEFEAYLDEHPEALTGRSTPPVTSGFFSVHLGEASLPEALRKIAAHLPPGSHEIERGTIIGEDYMLAVRETDQPDRRLYMLYDVRGFDEGKWWHSKVTVFVVGGGLVCAIGLLWASRYSRSVLQPLTGLAGTVANESEPLRLAEALAQRSDPVEVAVLGEAIEHSMREIDGYIRRQRAFTRNASHELRTPLAVIRGAVELLQYETLSSRAEQRLLRVERSVHEMETLIETFLWLARGDQEPPSDPVEIAPIVHRVIESHRHLLGDRDVDVEVDLEPDLSLAVREQIIAVAIANLVRNAFYSTEAGVVSIAGSANKLTVTDTGPGCYSERVDLDPDRVASGFGLAIVRELCEHNGWHFDLVEREPRGTVATIEFAPTGP